MSAAVRILLPSLCLFLAARAFAAPLPPFAPVVSTGRIAEANRVQERQALAIPGISGSAGDDLFSFFSACLQ